MRTKIRALVIGVVAVVLAVATIGGITGYARSGPGEVTVVRDGGPLDDTRIRQVIQPGSGLVWTGLFSTAHAYPAQQRAYTLTSDPNRGGRAGVDLLRAPSSDGVSMGVEATIFFSLNRDDATVRAFDERYGTREYRAGDDRRYPYDGYDGWTAFFDVVVRPVIESNLRRSVGRHRCAELVPSCALLQQAGTTPATTTPGTTATATTTGETAALEAIQREVDAALPEDVRATLGGPFFQDFRFTLVRVTLPTEVQDAVTKAQAAEAGTSEAQAKAATSLTEARARASASVAEAQAQVQQAKAEAEANRLRQQGYAACPDCAEIDKVKALPDGLTTYATGAPVAVGPAPR